MSADPADRLNVYQLAPLVARKNRGVGLFRVCFAKEFADRVCFFYEGKITEQGAPDEIFNNPKNERTQQFLSAVLEAG